MVEDRVRDDLLVSGVHLRARPGKEEVRARCQDGLKVTVHLRLKA